MLQQTTPELGAPGLHSMTFDAERDGSLDPRPVQYQGLGEIVNPHSVAQTGGYLSSYAQPEVLESGLGGTGRVERLET